MKALRRVLVVLAIVPALVSIGTFFRIAAARARYPMDIEWLEGGELYEAFRWIHGQTLYGPPDQGYLPFLHPPGHFIILGLFGRLFGIDYAMGRLVSVAFCALAAGIVAKVVLDACTTRTERLIVPVLAVGAAFASFPVVGGVYDLVRNDATGLGLVLAGIALVGDGRVSRARMVGAAALFTIAAYTRLPYLFLSMAAGAFVLVRSRKNGVLLFAATAGTGGAILALLQLASGGWFFRLTVTLLSRHPLSLARLAEGASSVVWFAPFLLAVPVVLATPSLRRKLRPRTALWCGVLAGGVPAGLLPFAKMGGFDNDLIPVVFLAGLVAALIVLDLVPARSRWMALAAASAWLVWRAYDASAFIPSADQRVKAERLNAFIAHLDGGVLIPSHPLLAVRNGHDGPQFHTMPYLDVLATGLGGGLYAYVEASRARWAILDGREPFVRDVVLALYEPVGPVPDAVPTMVGYPSSPRVLLERRPPVPKPDLRVVFDFESPSYPGWRISGKAFLAPPTAPKPADQLAFAGFRGRGLVNSYTADEGDGASGELVSPPFVLDRSHLSVLVAGGAGRATAVQLLVDGEVAFAATGTGSDVLEPVVWDVSALAGRTAQIAILDHDTGPNGHLLVDQIELFN